MSTTTQKPAKRPPTRSRRLPLAEFKARQARATEAVKRSMGGVIVDAAEELRETRLLVAAIDERLQTVDDEAAHPYVTAATRLALLDAKVDALIRAERAVQGSEHARMFHPAIQTAMSALLRAKEAFDECEHVYEQLIAEAVSSTIH